MVLCCLFGIMLPGLFSVIIPIPGGNVGGSGGGLALESVVVALYRPHWVTGAVVRARHDGWGASGEEVDSHRQTDRQTRGARHGGKK
jgi:hypothetical protein